VPTSERSGVQAPSRQYNHRTRRSRWSGASKAAGVSACRRLSRTGNPGLLTAESPGRHFIGQRWKALLTLSPACLMLPVAWPERPFVASRRFPVTRPVTFFILPLAVSALCPNIFPRLTTLFPIRVLRVLLPKADASRPGGGYPRQCLRRNMMIRTMITMRMMVPKPINMGASSLMVAPRGAELSGPAPIREAQAAPESRLGRFTTCWMQQHADVKPAACRPLSSAFGLAERRGVQRWLGRRWLCRRARRRRGPEQLETAICRALRHIYGRFS
jgi:hypothetical protein